VKFGHERYRVIDEELPDRGVPIGENEPTTPSPALVGEIEAIVVIAIGDAVEEL